MNIPAPAPLGTKPACSLAATFGWVSPAQLAWARETGRAPVLLHPLGSEKARQTRGPRELREETIAALEAAEWRNPWGLGALCESSEDAAQFATAGYTWFTLDLAAQADPRASSMSLDDLDAAIVRLEDTKVFPLGWHEAYLAGGSGPQFSEEALARAAVRFGPALAEADQMVQAIRAGGSERGDLPDLELSFARSPLAMSAEEVAFVAAELLRRGLIHGGVTRLAPSFGPWFERGADSAAEAPEIISEISRALPAGVMLVLPGELAGKVGDASVHPDATDESVLAWLRRLAERQPARFREWLAKAHAAFPTARAIGHFTTSEDDVRFLPEVADDALAATFLESTQGRQLLLATWTDVAEE